MILYGVLLFMNLVSEKLDGYLMYFVILLNRLVEYRFRGMVKIFGDTWIFDFFFVCINVLYFEYLYLFELLRIFFV